MCPYGYMHVGCVLLQSTTIVWAVVPELLAHPCHGSAMVHPIDWPAAADWAGPCSNVQAAAAKKQCFFDSMHMQHRKKVSCSTLYMSVFQGSLSHDKACAVPSSCEPEVTAYMAVRKVTFMVRYLFSACCCTMVHSRCINSPDGVLALDV